MIALLHRLGCRPALAVLLLGVAGFAAPAPGQTAPVAPATPVAPASPAVPAFDPAVVTATPPATSGPFSRAAAQIPASFRERPLRVVIRVLPPFVMKGDDGTYSGFSIDLWNELARRLKLQTEYHRGGTVDDLINDVATGKADVAISAITITAQRDVLIDFSQPMFEGGLQIAVRDVRRGGHPTELTAIWDVITSPNMLHLLLLMFISAIVIAHITWLVERRHEEGGVVEHKRYIPGIYKAFWWSMGTVGSQVDEMPRTWLGRIIALFWMFCAIIFVAYFTAAATSNLTVSTLKGNIQGPADLPGKRVAATTGSTGEAYLKQHHVNVVSVRSIGLAMKMLDEGDVEAVVADAPVLEYLGATDSRDQIQLVGGIFQKEFYGIVVANGSPLRLPINMALLEMQEDGSYNTLLESWFKADDDSSGD